MNAIRCCLERLLASRSERRMWTRFYTPYTLMQAARLCRAVTVPSVLTDRNEILDGMLRQAGKDY